MTRHTDTPSPAPICSLADLCQHWEKLYVTGQPRGRTLWVMFHDDSGVLNETIAVVEDVPLRPDERSLEGIEQLVRSVVDADPGRLHCIMMLTRPGPRSGSAYEQDWARSLSRMEDTMRWPVCCATPDGVTVLGAREGL